MASVSQAIEKCVSPMAVLLVVRMAHNTWGGWSTYALLGGIKLPFQNVLDEFADGFNLAICLKVVQY